MGLVKVFEWPVRVYYEDTDAGGVVYYANYLKYMERARTEWLRSLGFEQDLLLREAGIVFAVRRAEVDYVRPARFNEALMVTAGLGDLGRASLTFEHQILRPSDRQLLTAGVVKVACLHAASFRPVAIPDVIREKIQHADY